jgi:TonB family protein
LRKGEHTKTIAGILLITTVAAASEFIPARRVGGVSPPLPPPTAVGWLEEVVDLAVDARGRVSNVTTLRATVSPNLLSPVAATWRFRPAAVGGRPVRSHVLAVALIRPPQLFDGPTLGTEPTTLAAPPSDLPFPTVMHRPRYPPLAVGASLVLVEVLVGPDGRVRVAEIAEGSSTVFNDEALRAARNWEFRPAHHNGIPVSAYAYIAFGFRQPLSAQ